MLYSGTDPESYITGYTLVYEDYFVFVLRYRDSPQKWRPTQTLTFDNVTLQDPLPRHAGCEPHRVTNTRGSR